MIRTMTLLGITLLAAVPTHGQYGGGYYQPTYHQPYYQPVYYQQSYAYNVPTYSYYAAGYYEGWWYPAGYYSYQGGVWYLLGHGAYYPTQKQEAVKATPPKDWKNELLRTAEKRDEQAAYLQALKTLGLPQPIPQNAPYSSALAYAPQNAYQGSTVYGYTYSSIRDLYGQTNLNTLYQQAQRLAESSQQMGQQATRDFSQLVSQEGQSRGRVAEILAAGQAARMALEGARPGDSARIQERVQIQTQTREVQNQGQKQGEPGQQQDQSKQETARQTGAATPVSVQRCGECHSGKDPKGGFDIAGYPQMSIAERQKKVWPRLLLEDPEKRMPLGKQPLTVEEFKRFATE